MKLLDKIKDLFMDEVMDEDELELEEERKEEYKEPVKNELPKVMRETISREEKKEIKRIKTPEISEEKEKNSEELPHRKFNFPIDLDNEIEKKEEKSLTKKETQVEHKWDISNDFLTEKPHSNINVLQLEKEANRKVSELYANKKKEEKNIKPKFKASPVISPVYGILDKNYTKEEVKEKTDDVTTMKRPSKKVDFETVRKKAFGNLADDIKDSMLCENCELYKEVKKISALTEDDLLYDMTVEPEEEKNKEVTLEKAYDDYEEFGVAYEPTNKSKVQIEEEVKEEPVVINNNDNNEEEKLNNFTAFKSKIEKEEVEIINNVDVVPERKSTFEQDKIVTKEVEKVPTRSEKKADSKVDEDFFELIDSMYKERVDE